MRIPGAGRLKRAAAAVGRRFFPRAIILLYHRVCQLDTDPQLLAVTPERFAGHLDLLRTQYKPVSLSELAICLKNRSIKRGMVAVTFDDGYADNLQNAKPLLERYEIPATVFVTAGFIGSQREFFSDELDRLFLQVGTLPRTGSVLLNGTRVDWDLGDESEYADGRFRKQSAWNLLSVGDLSPRQTAYRKLCGLIRDLSPEARERALDGLRAWAGREPEGRETHRTLTAPEVRDLAQDGRITIGAHCMTHPRLSSLPPDRQRAEIADSRKVLTDILAQEVHFFSYPFGSRADYTSETVALVRDSGFEAACSAFAGDVQSGADVFQLPRVIVRNWPTAQFGQVMRRWLG